MSGFSASQLCRRVEGAILHSLVPGAGIWRSNKSEWEKLFSFFSADYRINKNYTFTIDSHSFHSMEFAIKRRVSETKFSNLARSPSIVPTRWKSKFRINPPKSTRFYFSPTVKRKREVMHFNREPTLLLLLPVKSRGSVRHSMK